MTGERRIANIHLDEATVPRRTPEAERERQAAVSDLLHDNSFAPTAHISGPFNLHLAVEENRLRFDIRDTDGWPLTAFTLPVTPFRGIIRDYYMTCDSYYAAVRNAGRARIEALDMSRRAVHNEGSALLRERLKPHVEVDDDTARRLFTLVCVLHWR